MRFAASIIVGFVVAGWNAGPAKATPPQQPLQALTTTTAVQRVLSAVPGQGPLRARIATTHGTIEVELLETLVPELVAHFVALARGEIAFRNQQTGRVQGGRFYDGLTFHRVWPGFMIQGGCPRGDGRGGPGFEAPNVFAAELLHDRPGRVAFAATPSGNVGSQFFIIEGPAPHLDGVHPPFGQVVSGMETIQRIANVARHEKTGQTKEVVRIEHVSIARAGNGGQSQKGKQGQGVHAPVGRPEKSDRVP